MAVTGLDAPAFWRDVEARCAGATATQRVGTYNWVVLHFRRGGTRDDTPSLAAEPWIDIGFEYPSMTRA